MENPTNVTFSESGDSVFENVYITGKLNYDFDNDDVTLNVLNGDEATFQNLNVGGNLNVTGSSTKIGLDIVTRNLKATGITTLSSIKDTNGSTGSAGQVLSTDGTDLEWINTSSANVNSASKVGVNLDSDSTTTMHMTFVDSTSGNEEIRVDKSLTYKPSTGSFLGLTTFTDIKSTSLHVTGGVKDTSGDVGNSGQVLSATGVVGGGTNWINVGDISAGSASSISVTSNNHNRDQFLAFVNEDGGTHQLRSDVGAKYNPSTNALTSGSFIKDGGSSSQFLKADGSVDSSTYLTSFSETDTLDSVCDRGSTTDQNITTSGTLNDAAGNVRELVNNAKTAAYTLTANDVGELINTDSNVTIPSGIFSAGQAITIYNNSGSNITLSRSGVTMYTAGESTNTDKTLAEKGICTVVCVSSNTFVASGAGMS